MSLHRRAAKRDKNEPAIVKTLEAHGCLVWPLSGKGIPDLLVFYRRRRNVRPEAEVVRHTFVADVKGPKEKPTPAQVEKWTALTNIGFAVFILRTPEDAVAMLNNALQPWEPEAEVPRGTCARCGHKKEAHGRRGCTRQHPRTGHCGCSGEPRSNYTPPRSTPVDAAKRVRGLGSEMMAEMLKPPGQENYDAALKRAMDAAKEAEATFAPADDGHKSCAHAGCTKRVLGSDTCMEHDPV